MKSNRATPGSFRLFRAFSIVAALKVSMASDFTWMLTSTRSMGPELLRFGAEGRKHLGGGHGLAGECLDLPFGPAHQPPFGAEPGDQPVFGLGGFRLLV